MVANEYESSSELDNLIVNSTENENHLIRFFLLDGATTNETKGLRGVSMTQSILESINVVN